MVWILDGGPGHRPGVEWEEGRLWIPGDYIPDEVATGAVDVYGASAMTCSPYARYVFVRPRTGGEYNAQEFIDWRDNNAVLTAGLNSATAGFVFWLGDSSECGGTEIAQNTSDPMQAFLRSTETKTAFSVARITRGGFFLLGDRQDAAKAATEIKKIMFDCNLDFLVLAVHRKEGETEPDISLTALKHLIGSIRWDVGPKKPIIVMLGDENSNNHLMPESRRGNMFVGDITDQTTQAKQQALLDRAGYLALNWWPMIAFTPNANNGIAVTTSMTNMSNRLFHPLLIPQSGSGCPFNTQRNLTVAEVAAARLSFAQTNMFPLAEPKVRTTSAWFWDFDSVRHRSDIQAYSVLRNRLTANSAFLDFMSDMQVAFESTPPWVGHPIFEHDFAMEFRMQNRSLNNMVIWDRDTANAGNIPELHGAKDEQAGWLTIVTPFELSQTASKFYGKDIDPRVVPVIPSWVKFSWLREISENSRNSDSPNWLGIPGLPSPGDVIEGLLDLLEDALTYIPNRLGINTNTEGHYKWSAGLNQPHVVLYGKPPSATGGVTAQGVTKLDLNSAPFAVHIQTVNIDMNGDLGFVWPGHVFNIVPIAVDDIIRVFDPALTPVGLTEWDDLGFDIAGGGTSPLRFEMGIVPLVEGETNLRIPRFDILKPLLDHKGDFPPMMGENDAFLGRDFSNHLARIDTTHPGILRAFERCYDPACGGGGRPGGGRTTRGAIQNWPIPEDREILITQGFEGQAYPYPCGQHNSLDLIYTDGSASYSTPILAIATGTVSLVGWCSDCGPYIEIVHQIPPLPSQSTFTSQYMHLSNTYVNVGDVVMPGQQIGTMGSEGLGNALHLHFHLSITGADPCRGALNPCDEMPEPLNGIRPPGCHRGGGWEGSDIATLICRTVEDAVATAGEDPYIVDRNGNRLRKSTLAVAIARQESSLQPRSQNCIDYFGTTLSHVGLFQIQNPTQIDNDIAAGIISAASVVTNDPNCPGIRVAQDYKVAPANIESFLRMSSRVTYLDPWEAYTSDAYLNHLGTSECPPETWVT